MIRKILSGKQPDPAFYFDQSPGNLEEDREKEKTGRISDFNLALTGIGCASLASHMTISGDFSSYATFTIGLGLPGAAALTEAYTVMPKAKRLERLKSVTENTEPNLNNYIELFNYTDIVKGRLSQTKLPEMFIDEEDFYLELASNENLGTHYHVKHPSGYEIWAEINQESDYVATDNSSIGLRGVNRVLGD